MTSSAGTATTIRTPVERIEPGRTARAQLADADYADAFRIPDGPAAPSGAWARRAFQAGPRLPRALFQTVVWHGLLGMRLVPEGTPGHLAGWRVAVDDPGLFVMEVDSWMLTGRLVTEATASGATITTLLRFDRPLGRRVWAVLGGVHRAMMPGVLRGAAWSLSRRPA